MSNEYKVSITEIGKDTKFPNNRDYSPRAKKDENYYTEMKQIKIGTVFNFDNMNTRREYLISNQLEKQKIRMNSILNELKIGNSKKEINKFSNILTNYYNTSSNQDKTEKSKKPEKYIGNSILKAYHNNLEEKSKHFNEYETYSKEALIKLITEKDDYIDYLLFNNDRLQKKLKEINIEKENFDKKLNLNKLLTKLPENKESLKTSVTKLESIEIQDEIKDDKKIKVGFFDLQNESQKEIKFNINSSVLKSVKLIEPKDYKVLDFDVSQYKNKKLSLVNNKVNLSDIIIRNKENLDLYNKLTNILNQTQQFFIDFK